MNRILRLMKYGGVLLAGGPLLVSAQSSVPVIATSIEDLVIKVLCPIAGYLFTIALIVGIIMALVAAYKYMSSGGDTNKVSEAHKTLTFAAIGIAVALLAGSVPLLVGSLLDWQSVSRC